MTPERATLHIGLVAFLPLVAWVLPPLAIGSDPALTDSLLTRTFSTGWWLQLTLLALLVPPLASQPRVRQMAVPLLLVVVLPWPVLSLSWLSGSMTYSQVLLSQVGTLTFGLLLLAVARWALGQCRGAPRRATMRGALQLLALAVTLTLPFDRLLGLVP